ncbi:FAD-binding protein [Wenxinia saemankumensis]|uniref:FAD-binding protein n=1 Tax=Wenxinia saemankumensis TaxID=1447782 RepID=UPI000932A171|nr:FAD-binding protein [Wenxinia saemankumensis]
MRPTSESELADAIRGATGPLSVRGGDTRGMAPAGTPLVTAGLSGIRLYEPGALTLVAGAGTPLAEIEAALAAEGQRLSFEPMDHRALLGTTGVPTIGGVAAANVSGPRRIQAGAARDVMLGLRFVDGTGRIVANGGRVMKNVTGYDLVRLLAGSRGTLGVLSEVALKTLPVPETECTLLAEGLAPGGAVDAMSRALGTPFEVSGAAHLPDGRTALRLEGRAASVRYRAEALRGRLGGTWAEAADSAALWREVRDVTAFAGGHAAIWRCAIRPSRAAALLAAIGTDHRALLDWGGGLVWLSVPSGGAEAVRGAAARLGGQASLVRRGPVPAEVPALPPESPAVTALSEGLRRKFDPRGLFSAPLRENA